MVISEAVQRSIRDMLEKDLVLRTVLPHHFNHMSVGQVRNNGGISDEERSTLILTSIVRLCYKIL